MRTRYGAVMTDRRGGSGFSFEPQRVGGPGAEPGRGRRNLLAVLVVVVGFAVIAFALFGERLTSRPNLDLSFLPTPAPTPSASPSRRPAGPSPAPTDLPRLSRGGEVRSGTVPFLADGFRLLDLEDGDVTMGATVAVGRDVVIPNPSGDGWLCVCSDDDVTTGALRTVFELKQIEPDGTEGRVLDGGGRAFIVNPDGQVFDEVALRSDRSTGLVVVAAGAGLDWRISVATLDLAAGTIGPYTDLSPPAAAPSPSPSPSINPDEYGFSWEPPYATISPDSRSAIVWQAAMASGPRETTIRRQAWRLALDPDGAVVGVEAIGLDVPSYCGTLVFTRADELLSACPRFPLTPEDPVAPGFSVRVMDVEGRVLSEMTLPMGDTGWGFESLIDRANRMVYLWEPTERRFTRIDLDTLATDAVTYELGAQRAPGIEPATSERPPEWLQGGTAGYLSGFHTMTPTPDGSRLLAVGMSQSTSSQAGGPMVHGIFAIDRASMALVGRWAPAAAYVALSVLADGRSVAAAGNPWSDVQGIQREWQGSLTIHDIDDGRIIARYGQLGQGMPPLVIPP